MHGAKISRYEESLFRFNAAVIGEQGRGELRRTLRSTPMSETNTQAFVELFTDCDLVKFAEFNPSVDAANQLVEQARQLVLITAAEVAQQAEDENNNANGANPPSATTTISTTVAGA